MREPIVILIAIILMCISLTACAKQIEVTPINKRPLPSGAVTLVKDNNGAIAYQLRVADILAPSELEARAAYYIIWVISEDDQTIERVAEWQGKVAKKSFLIKTSLVNPRFTVTAEPDLNVTRPTGPAILRDLTVEPVKGY
jgi:hypothetical protein